MTNQNDEFNMKIKQQVEFYFSDFNLHRDKFMQEHMQVDDGWFHTSVLLRFKKLARLCRNPSEMKSVLYI